MSTLLERPQGFDLFQALHLLERSQPQRMPVGSSLGLDEAVRLAGHVSLGFAPSDIQAVSAADRPGPPLTLASAAMVLAGAQGPLPSTFTELLLESARQQDRAGLAFLDIFHQRLLGFLYRGRRKHHVALTPGTLQTAPPLRALDALSGLGLAEGARGPGGQRAWLRHAGLQSAAPRSMASLLALLRDRLGLALRGHSLVGAWHPLAREERACLSSRGGRALGDGPALGARAWDPGAGLCLSTPPLRNEQFESLLPGGPAHGLLAWLVARHQQRDTAVHLQVAIAQAPPARLCARPAAATGLAPLLGLSAWLRGPAGPAGVRCASPRFLLSVPGPAHGH